MENKDSYDNKALYFHIFYCGNNLFNIRLNFILVSNCEQYGCSNDRKNITRNITGASVLNPFGNKKLLGKSYNTADESHGEQYSVCSKKDSCGRMSKPHVLLPGLYVFVVFT